MGLLIEHRRLRADAEMPETHHNDACRGVRKPMADWDVLIKDHHAAYISWDEFERNLRAIANNATGMSSSLARGAAREGELLLPGLLRCGHCGRKLYAHYGGKLGRYQCYGARTNHGTDRCISVSGLSMDAAIAKEVLQILKPVGVEAAVKSLKGENYVKAIDTGTTLVTKDNAADFTSAWQ